MVWKLTFIPDRIMDVTLTKLSDWFNVRVRDGGYHWPMSGQQTHTHTHTRMHTDRHENTPFNNKHTQEPRSCSPTGKQRECTLPNQTNDDEVHVLRTLSVYIE